MTEASISRINALQAHEARAEFLRCCGAAVWADAMTARRPYVDVDDLMSACEAAWPAMDERDWREAFSHHPKIGDIDSLRAKFATTAGWASGEQSGASAASDATLLALAKGNAAYEKRFGYIFIVCATGKTAEEMLAFLLGAPPKRTGGRNRHRGERAEENHTPPPRKAVTTMSPITTHVLDTSRGAPAADVPVVLEHQQAGGAFSVIGDGTTNADGRVTDLLPSDYSLTSGVYRLTFETSAYFAAIGVASAFFPQVSLSFSVVGVDEGGTSPHYHVPLLLSPFGYTTYRGS